MTAAVAPDLRTTFRSMASDVKVWIVSPNADAATMLDSAREVFARVETTCTRFDPDSPLMCANRAGRRWEEVPQECLDAVAAAAAAYRSTGGLFDPRVLDVLQSYGYSRSLPFEEGAVSVPGQHRRTRRWRTRRTWTPGIDQTRLAVRIGAVPIDLGGIGKGLAVDWATEKLQASGDSVLIEAGGDCYAQGVGPEGQGWAIGVEDPRGSEDPIAVLRLTDRAVATSSTRLRNWTADGTRVHHLIDPRTSRPAAGDLLSVTVVGRQVATAEVWAKALFVAGRTQVRALADREHLAALWVGADGKVGRSRAMGRYVAWLSADVS